MAIPLLSPKTATSPETIEKISNEYSTPFRLRLVKSIIPLNPKTNTTEISGKFLGILALVISINLVGVLAINTQLDQLAFKIQKLKTLRNLTLDQKNAILTQEQFLNSPNHISAQALKYGMIPSPTLNYINLNKSTVKLGKK